jgi:biotin transport system substrate-specific component
MVFSTNNMVKVAIFTSLTVGVSVFMRFSAGIIPFSLLPLMVMLAGNILGSKLGALTMILYLMLGLFGIPVFASPPYGGLGYIFQPSFGFLLGFIFGSYVVGRITEMAPGSLKTYLLANFTGVVTINFFGLLYFWVLYNFIFGNPTPISKIVKIGLLPFIFPDLAKGVVASLLAVSIHKRLKWM